MNRILRAWRNSFSRRWATNFHMRHVTDFNCSHQGRVVVLVILLFPQHRSYALLAHAATHDQGEAGSADMSSPLKKANPVLASALRVLEEAEMDAQGFRLPNLTPKEERMLKLCDWLDAWLVMMAESRHQYSSKAWQRELELALIEAYDLGVGAEVRALVDAEVTG